MNYTTPTTNTETKFIGLFNLLTFINGDYLIILTIDVKMEKENVPILSITGNVYEKKEGKFDILANCGQVVDYLDDTDVKQSRIKEIWNKYHLNDIHAGTRRQEQALTEKFGAINANIYSEMCEYLKSINLFYDEGYKFGSQFLTWEIPKEVIDELRDL